MYRRFLIVMIVSLFIGFTSHAQPKDHSIRDFAKTMLRKVTEQYSGLLNIAYEKDRIPRTVNSEDEIRWVNTKWDWTEGFFPGTCWYLYEFTKDVKWKVAATYFEQKYIDHRKLTTHHDLGFVFNCSYGNGYRLLRDQFSEEILVEAASSLSKRFDAKVGCIKSWDVNKGWQAKRGWQYPVIVDNMLNLELLFEASIITKQEQFKEIAVKHALTTMKNHFRKDYSSFHVVDYDSITGKVRSRQTAQGLSDDSSWARGQAWGLYGYTLCYRYTKDQRFLDHATKIANYILKHPTLPDDLIPRWDYDATGQYKMLRDASAAAITASALLELSQYTNGSYQGEAIKIIKSLSSKYYFSKKGKNHHFVLKHCVGSIPHDNEIDKPLIYADYYYIEALLRVIKLN